MSAGQQAGKWPPPSQTAGGGRGMPASSRAGVTQPRHVPLARPQPGAAGQAASRIEGSLGQEEDGARCLYLFNDHSAILTSQAVHAAAGSTPHDHHAHSHCDVRETYRVRRLGRLVIYTPYTPHGAGQAPLAAGRQASPLAEPAASVDPKPAAETPPSAVASALSSETNPAEAAGPPSSAADHTPAGEGPWLTAADLSPAETGHAPAAASLYPERSPAREWGLAGARRAAWSLPDAAGQLPQAGATAHPPEGGGQLEVSRGGEEAALQAGPRASLRPGRPAGHTGRGVGAGDTVQEPSAVRAREPAGRYVQPEMFAGRLEQASSGSPRRRAGPAGERRSRPGARLRPAALSAVLRPRRLTADQQAVYRLLRKGLTNRQIALRLGRCRRWVVYRVAEIKRELGVATRAAIMIV